MSTVRRIAVTLADRFFLLRPLVMIPAVTFFLLGHRAAHGGKAGGDGRFPLAVVAYAILMGSVYVVNQIADVESDRANDKLFLLPNGIVKRTEALVLAAALAVFSMAAALRVGGTTPWFFGLSLVMGVAYSVPPMALKRVFPFDIVWNALGYGIVAYATGWSVVRSPRLLDITNAVPFALCVAGVFVLTALVDRKGDESTGFKSTGVALGLKQGVWLALVFVAAALVLAVLVENRLAAIGSGLSLAFFAYAALKANFRSAKIAYRCSSAIFVLIVGVIYPLFLAVALALLGLSRIYYSRRFSLEYPSVRGR